ncbi:bifunctional DNA-binding transcriptional regulator/O6-methylguanine-DNA methyltransferase Ada [Enterobacteriales bacterium SAP-6]|uniref:Bifunctional DNA-binding transcriptional regulator/O6-methylguanine-DNA methyltransferase Ada n=2 Tax=Acerihabitans arboris TaxID=2691583 RepID=A0A845SFS4_9GAMM|nr:bifunctional DNA-binding transcriptional regulator/O6-methylguanine-DNA methyltransferase Ada [Acerihabitans arboris]
MMTIEQDPRWQAIVTRDKTADDRFIYAVRTTGIFCSPSCPSRLPLAGNVLFFANAEEALRAGYRPCKRCRQGRSTLAEEQAAKVALACRYIERADGIPPLAELARQAALSPFHFHRLFKSLTGLTPKAYAVAWRNQRVRRRLAESTRVTDAVLDAGFNSPGRFYAGSDALLGMTPTAYRAGGLGMDIVFAVGRCTLGDILVAQSARGICAILLGDDAQRLVEQLQDTFPQAVLAGDDEDFARRVALVVGFVDAPALGLDLPLDIRGTAFQQRVWQALREIPPGRTASYLDVAKRIGSPAAVRAVAGACAANMLAVAIPCHRVVRSDGALSGYRWGVERKRRLLDTEAKG